MVEQTVKSSTKSQPRMMAAPPRQKIKPAFTVQKINGTREQTVIRFTPEGKRKDTFVEVDAGYLVTVSKGDSFRVDTIEELHRMGFDDVIPMIDEEGEVQGYLDNPIATEGATK